ncbi:hypothetical protein SAMN05216353_13936 [Halobacillus alkaliphilus]|uniref:HNH endonuclease n=1 Tax=Halobacillus alkaliphilus TaxID=396056 RepID=A0A1I2REN1_9BACI|nr:hypothetical protein [Halobacillus alkaliphilus]SFG39134.1 hypothetical protein SAMN05216353_13936 [Halobacillus alkaliphilus]
MSDFKLTIEIRKPSYAQNKTVRDSIPRSLWNSIRNHVHEKNDFTCQICGCRDEEKLQAHEVWKYDEEEFLLILKDIQSLCKSCHDLKHIQHAALRINDRNKRNFVMQKLMKHFIKVNNCTEEDFRNHYRNQLAKSNPSPVNRSLEDLIEIRELRAREEFLKAQNWKFVIADNVPFANEIKSNLHQKGLLYTRKT